MTAVPDPPPLNLHPDRPKAYGGCTCECHQWEVAHVMPCCYPSDDDLPSYATATARCSRCERLVWRRDIIDFQTCYMIQPDETICKGQLVPLD